MDSGSREDDAKSWSSLLIPSEAEGALVRPVDGEESVNPD
jgi:hypothetical protein